MYLFANSLVGDTIVCHLISLQVVVSGRLCERAALLLAVIQHQTVLRRVVLTSRSNVLKS